MGKLYVSLSMLCTDSSVVDSLPELTFAQKAFSVGLSQVCGEDHYQKKISFLSNRLIFGKNAVPV